MIDMDWTFDPSGDVPAQLNQLKSSLATPLSWVIAVIAAGIVIVLAMWLLRRIWLRVIGLACSLVVGIVAHQVSQPAFEAILPLISQHS